MSRIFTLKKQMQFFIVLCFALLSAITGFAQSICGPVAEHFNIQSNGTAGFASPNAGGGQDLVYSSQGSGQNFDGFLQKTQVEAGAIYMVHTPTYVLPNNATSVGYGFELNGTRQIARVEVSIVYVSRITGQFTTRLLATIVPIYGTGNEANIARICRAVELTELPGFQAGDAYRFRIELTSNEGMGRANDTITFDDFRTNGTRSQSPLPVDFLSLTGKKLATGTQLTWKVGTEINVDRYEVEKSTNGKQFTRIGTVTAEARSAYSFTEQKALEGAAYYRIKEVDIDGKFKYSFVLAMFNNNASIVLRAYPMPARNQVTLQHATAHSGARITISTVDGRIVKVLSPSANAVQTDADLTALNSGMYVINYEDGKGATQSLKIVKQ